MATIKLQKKLQLYNYVIKNAKVKPSMNITVNGMILERTINLNDEILFFFRLISIHRRWCQYYLLPSIFSGTQFSLGWPVCLGWCFESTSMGKTCPLPPGQPASKLSCHATPVPLWNIFFFKKPVQKKDTPLPPCACVTSFMDDPHRYVILSAYSHSVKYVAWKPRLFSE